MLNQPFIKTGESEIDQLVVEELFSSKEFQKWLLTKLNLNDVEFKGAWKSFLAKYGECDVAALFQKNDEKILILIEDKIYAPEQHEQAKRYHKSGQFLIDSKEITKYVTCLLSPKIYFKEDAPMKDYEFRISYEDFLAWFEGQDSSKRNYFKKLVIKNGIERARTGYVRLSDELTDNFYKYYETLCRDNFPELEYKKPKAVASGNSWIRFNPKIFPSNVTIIHKGRHGYVDLQISEGNFDNVKNLLSENMSLHSTGKSISIRIIVPEILDINKIENPENYQDRIILVLTAVKELYEWFIEHKGAL